MRRLAAALQASLLTAVVLTMCGCDVPITNRFASPATDVEVHFTGVSVPAGCTASVPGFPTSATNGNVIRLTGGSIPVGGKTTLSVSGCPADAVSGTYLSPNLGWAAANIGPTTVQVADAGSGNFDVSFVNGGLPVSYDSLAGYTGADDSFFMALNPAGTPSVGTTAGVMLTVPASGTFASGTTLVAVIHPLNYGVTGLIANIDGFPYAVYVAIPEPGTFALLLTALGGLVALARRKWNPARR